MRMWLSFIVGLFVGSTATLASLAWLWARGYIVSATDEEIQMFLERQSRDDT